MKVKDLKQLLENYPDDMNVAIAINREEGVGFHYLLPLSGKGPVVGEKDATLILYTSAEEVAGQD